MIKLNIIKRKKNVEIFLLFCRGQNCEPSYNGSCLRYIVASSTLFKLNRYVCIQNHVNYISTKLQQIVEWYTDLILKWVKRHLFGHLTLLYTTVVVSHSIGHFMQQICWVSVTMQQRCWVSVTVAQVTYSSVRWRCWLLPACSTCFLRRGTEYIPTL